MYILFISVAISVAIIFVFRYLDRNNRSLDKVKKFTDKIKSEFDAYYDKKNQELQNSTVDLQVKQTQAIATVKKLEKLYEEFSQKSNELTTRIEAVKKIESKIGEYDDTIKTLSDMSSSVEENLSRLKSESTVIDKLNTKLEEQKQFIEQLQKRIPAIEQNFSKDNNEKLKNIGQNLLVEYQSQADSIKSLTTEAVKRNEDILSQITESFDNAFAQAAEKADKLEASSFEQLKEKAFERAEKYKQLAEEKNNQLKESIKTHLLETQEQIKAVNSETIALSEKTTQELKKNSEIFTTLKQNCASEVENIQSSLNTSLSGISEKFEKKSNSVFAEANTKLESLKNDMLYRFERLEKSSSDIDVLEASLNKAMNEVEKRVLGDFTIFSKEQQKQYANFKNDIKVHSDEVSIKVQSLEGELNELKKRAYDNVSDKLNGFEEDFFKDLSKRGDELSESLEKWQLSYNQKVQEISQKYEEKQISIETNYAEELKEKMALLQDKYNQQFSRMELAFSEKEKGLSDKGDDLEKELAKFAQTYQVALDTAKVQASDYLKNEFDNYISGMNDQVNKFESEITQQLTSISSDVGNSRNQAATVLESIRKDFDLWKERLNSQFDEAKTMYSDKFGSLDANATEMVNQIKHTFESDLAQYTEKTKESQDRISAEIQKLSEDSQNTIEQYETRSNEMLNSIKTQYDEIVEDTQKRIREQNADADQRLRNEKILVQEIKEKNEAAQEKMILKMQSDANKMNDLMDDIDKRLKQFVNQSQVFEKADELTKKLDDRIDNIKTEMNRIESFNKNIEAIEKDFDRIRKSEEEISQKANRFVAEKKHIDTMEADFNKLLELSSSIDTKIKDLEETNDDMQSLQFEVRKFKETLADISTRYDRLEKKNDVIDKTVVAVDKAFDTLKEVERRLQNCSSTTESLPDQIGGLKHDIDKLLENTPRVKDALEKLESIDGILSGTETRMAELKNSSEWLARTETRLQDLSRDAESQVRLLGEITKNSLTNKSSNVDGAPPLSVRENIIKLAHQGWKPEVIASRLKISLGEVELILETSGK